MPTAEQKLAAADLGTVVRRAVGAAAEIAHNAFLRLLHGHRHQVAIEVGDDPDGAGDDEKDDQHAEGES